MFKVLKVLHVVGMAMFLGSILAHIAAGKVPHAVDDPAMLFARQAIVLATRYVTLPGLTLGVGSGILMLLRSPSLIKRRWVALHVAGAAALVGVTMLVMVPIGKELLDAATALVAGTLSLDVFAGLLRREHAFGAFNIVLLFVVIVLGVVKPRLKQAEL